VNPERETLTRGGGFAEHIGALDSKTPVHGASSGR
jgi:hypothetical protein